jgi:predicted nuclease of predicted toxin-antitoxin system
VIKLYLDENVPESVAMALRLRGYDVITVKEAGRKGLSDIEQLEYASSENRLIFTFNVADFHKIHSEFIKTGRHHNGIIFSKQLPVRRIVTNAAISKATLMSFPLVGNLSEKPRRIADKPQ